MGGYTGYTHRAFHADIGVASLKHGPGAGHLIGITGAFHADIGVASLKLGRLA